MAEIKGLVKNSDNIAFLATNTKEMSGNLHVTGNVTVTGEVHNEKFKIVTFADGTDEEIAKMLEAHYNGDINIEEYWSIGDQRIMHINAMSSGTGTGDEEEHVAQDMIMIIIGFNHDKLKESIGKRNMAAVTLQCKEMLGNNGDSENAYVYGISTPTTNDSNYANNPKRTWLNNAFVNSLPIKIQPLIKTVVKKNLANHIDSTAGSDTEDKAFLTSYSEMFGSIDYQYYSGSENLEGKQYQYYNSNEKRIKYYNNNGNVPYLSETYLLRSPSSVAPIVWIAIYHDGTVTPNTSTQPAGIAPAFCL